ncbi:hypothetical protein T439DRAFT_322036 [Meredithblackwellia eburnea MCA 4105]
MVSVPLERKGMPSIPPNFPLSAPDLARWEKFARSKGGIGKAVAKSDKVARSAEDLMMLEGDDVTVLLSLDQQEGIYLGYCEGVVGKFNAKDVNFTSKLKRPVLLPRTSSSFSQGTVAAADTAPPSPIIQPPLTPPPPLGASSSRASSATSSPAFQPTPLKSPRASAPPSSRSARRRSLDNNTTQGDEGASPFPFSSSSPSSGVDHSHNGTLDPPAFAGNAFQPPPPSSPHDNTAPARNRKDQASRPRPSTTIVTRVTPHHQKSEEKTSSESNSSSFPQHAPPPRSSSTSNIAAAERSRRRMGLTSGLGISVGDPALQMLQQSLQNPMPALGSGWNDPNDEPATLPLQASSTSSSSNSSPTLPHPPTSRSNRPRPATAMLPRTSSLHFGNSATPNFLALAPALPTHSSSSTEQDLYSPPLPHSPSAISAGSTSGTPSLASTSPRSIFSESTRTAEEAVTPPLPSVESHVAVVGEVKRRVRERSVEANQRRNQEEEREQRPQPASNKHEARQVNGDNLVPPSPSPPLAPPSPNPSQLSAPETAYPPSPRANNNLSALSGKQLPRSPVSPRPKRVPVPSIGDLGLALSPSTSNLNQQPLLAKLVAPSPPPPPPPPPAPASHMVQRPARSASMRHSPSPTPSPVSPTGFNLANGRLPDMSETPPTSPLASYSPLPLTETLQSTANATLTAPEDEAQLPPPLSAQRIPQAQYLSQQAPPSPLRGQKVVSPPPPPIPVSPVSQQELPLRSKFSDISLASSRLQSKFSSSTVDHQAPPSSFGDLTSDLQAVLQQHARAGTPVVVGLGAALAVVSESSSDDCGRLGRAFVGDGGGESSQEEVEESTSEEEVEEQEGNVAAVGSAGSEVEDGGRLDDSPRRPSVPGEETELFGSIFDAYRYSRTESDASGGSGGGSLRQSKTSPAPSSPSSPFAARTLGRSGTMESMLGGGAVFEPERGEDEMEEVVIVDRPEEDGDGEENGSDLDDSHQVQSQHPATPRRPYGAASELRSLLSAGGSASTATPGSAGTTRTAIPGSSSLARISNSRDSLMVEGVRIPRLRELFPRSSTTDSFTSIASLPSTNYSTTSSSHTPALQRSTSTPVTTSSPSPSPPPPPSSLSQPDIKASVEQSALLPSDTELNSPDAEVPVPRRLFQTYFSPPRESAEIPRSRLVLGLPNESPSPPESPRRRTGSRNAKYFPSSNGGLDSGAPAPTWRSMDSPTDVGPKVVNDLFTTPSPTSSSFPPSPRGAPVLAIHEGSPIMRHPPPSHPQATLAPISTLDRSYYDDPNPPPLGSRQQKVTMPSLSPLSATFDYSLRSPITPTFSTHSGGTEGSGSAYSPAEPTFPIPPSPGGTMHSTGSMPRSKSLGNLRDNNKLKKPNLRLKTSHAMMRSDGASGISSDEAVKPVSVRARREGPESPRTPPKVQKSASSGSLFSRRKQEDRPAKPFYGAPISNKDIEEETVRLGETEFDIIKPLAALLLKDDESSGGRPSLSSISTGPNNGRPSVINSRDASLDSRERDMDSLDEHGLIKPYGVYSSSNGDFARSAATISHFAIEMDTPGTDPKSIEIYRAKELSWIKTMSSLPASQVRKSKKMKTLVQSGIPSSVRGRVWSYLAEANDDRVEGLFQSLCGLHPLPSYDAIEREIVQTFHDDPQFGTGSTLREDLESVLQALGRYESELGYAKGLSWTVATLLSHVPAEEAFYILVALVKKYNFRSYFQGYVESLLVEVRVFSLLLESADSKLSKHLKQIGVSTDMFLPSWFTTLFATALPPASRLRCIDLFFFDPVNSFRIALAILDVAKPRLLACAHKEAALSLLANLPYDGSLELIAILPAVLGTKLKEDKIRQTRKRVEATMRLSRGIKA